MLSLLQKVPLLLTLLYTTSTLSAIIRLPSFLTPSNSSLTTNRIDPARCNQYPDWIGDGILDTDCRAALNELYRSAVEPTQGQKYEFLRRGVRRVSYNPEWITPREWWHGTCTIVIAMLDQFPPGSLPGEPSSLLPTLRSDVATFEELHNVANDVYSQCVFTLKPAEQRSEAGWSFAGKSNSIGVFIIREKGRLYYEIMAERRFGLEAALNGSASAPFVELPTGEAGSTGVGDSA